MTDNEQVERVAKAIAKAMARNWDDLHRRREVYRMQALVAIAAMSDTLAVKVKPLVWITIEGAKGFSGKGGPSTYYVMPCRNLDWRVYGISGEHDGAAQFPTLEKAKAAAEAHHREAVWSQIEAQDTPALKAADELADVVEALSLKALGDEWLYESVFHCEVYETLNPALEAYRAARKDTP